MSTRPGNEKLEKIKLAYKKTLFTLLIQQLTCSLLNSAISVNKTAKRAKVPRQKLTTVFKNQGNHEIFQVILVFFASFSPKSRASGLK